MKIQIGKHEVGDGCKPFIIAEVGSNWTNYEDCEYSIRAAKACGADAVKFQLFEYESLYGIGPDLAAVLFLDPQMHIYNKLNDLPIEWLPRLKAMADKYDIEFMCSAFSPELLEAVNPYVNVHKLASAEMTHVRMLEKLRHFGKPLFMSTGASGAADIKQSLWHLGHVYETSGDYYLIEHAPKVVLMYCVASYPAQEVNLGTIPLLRTTFDNLVGYSDHSLDVLEIPKNASKQGACVIEKHFSAIDSNTPDRAHSLSVDQFRLMVQSIQNGVEPTISSSRSETPMLIRHNRRLLAISQINAGDIFREGVNFGIYRSLKDDTHAFSPFMVNEVNGRVALKEIKAGDGIGPGDV